MNLFNDQVRHSYPENHIMQHILSDGSPIMIRPIRHNESEMIKEFSRHLSAELKHINYMENFYELPTKRLTKITQVDYIKTMTLIATYSENEKEIVIGMVHYIADDNENCEFDMIVTDDWQNKGLGTLLTETLIKCAKSNGIKSIKLIILASNVDGLMLAKRFGFLISNSDEPTVKIATKNL